MYFRKNFYPNCCSDPAAFNKGSQHSYFLVLFTPFVKYTLCVRKNSCQCWVARSKSNWSWKLVCNVPLHHTARSNYTHPVLQGNVCNKSWFTKGTAAVITARQRKMRERRKACWWNIDLMMGRPQVCTADSLYSQFGTTCTSFSLLITPSVLSV